MSASYSFELKLPENATVDRHFVQLYVFTVDLAFVVSLVMFPIALIFCGFLLSLRRDDKLRMVFVRSIAVALIIQQLGIIINRGLRIILPDLVGNLSCIIGFSLVFSGEFTAAMLFIAATLALMYDKFVTMVQELGSESAKKIYMDSLKCCSYGTVISAVLWTSALSVALTFAPTLATQNWLGIEGVCVVPNTSAHLLGITHYLITIILPAAATVIVVMQNAYLERYYERDFIQRLTNLELTIITFSIPRNIASFVSRFESDLHVYMVVDCVASAVDILRVTSCLIMLVWFGAEDFNEDFFKILDNISNRILLSMGKCFRKNSKNQEQSTTVKDSETRVAVDLSKTEKSACLKQVRDCLPKIMDLCPTDQPKSDVTILSLQNLDSQKLAKKDRQGFPSGQPMENQMLKEVPDTEIIYTIVNKTVKKEIPDDKTIYTLVDSTDEGNRVGPIEV